MPALRDAMQSMLDEMQSDETDELAKVSLERLATIDPELIIKIKRIAEDSLRNGGGGGSSGNKNNAQQNESGASVLNFLVETRAPETIERSKAWEKLKLDRLSATHDIVAALQHLVVDGSKSENRYMRQEAIDMTGALAAAAATAGILADALQQIRDEEKKSKSGPSGAISGGGSLGGASGTPARGFFKVDTSQFTNEGIKKKNDAVIGILYEVGLPFVSSSDGRRFASQLELSNHLDALFKKGYVQCVLKLITRIPLAS
jgi:pre-mRNA cleavage complex 2 protein Pcf11